MKQKKYDITIAIIIIVALILTFFIDYHCPFHEYLHIKCPGCGGRDMILHLLHFEFYEAFMSNQLLFIALPIGIILLFIKYILKKDIKINIYIYFLLMIITIIFAILRNVL